MKRIISILVLTAILVSCVCFVSAVDEDQSTVVLIKNGTPEYTIVYTQSWLQGHWDYRERVINTLNSAAEDMTGTALPVKEAMEALQEKEIYVGTTDRLIGDNQRKRQDDGLDFSYDMDLLGEDGFLIRTCGSRYVIIGGSYESSLKAVGVFSSQFCSVPEGADATLLVPTEIHYVSCETAVSDRKAKLTFGDEDFSGYTVVISEHATSIEKKKADDFRRAVFTVTGSVLPLSIDTAAENGKCVLIGHTAFYDDTELADNEYRIKAENGNLILAGGNSYSLDFAVSRFLADELSIINGVYVGNGAQMIPSDLNISGELPFGLMITECPDYSAFMRDNIRDLLETKDTVCYSDPSVADRLYEALNTDKLKSGDEVFLISNTADYCTCENCRGKADAFMTTVNEVARRFAPAGVTVSTLAYKETRAPSDIRMEENVRVYFADPNVCCAHALNDDACESNKAIVKDLEAWIEACSDVVILDFTQNYYSYPSTFPNLRVLQPNFAYYKENGINGVIMAWDPNRASLEFGELRSRMIGALIHDPLMSEDAYTQLFEDTMTELFTSYAPKIAEYLRRFEEASSEHFTILSKPSEILPIRKTDGKTGAAAYDLTLAKELGQLWEDVYRRHDPPEEELTGHAMDQLYDDYIHSDYYKPLHARVQYSTWIDANVPVRDRTEVYQAIIDSFTK